MAGATELRRLRFAPRDWHRGPLVRRRCREAIWQRRHAGLRRNRKTCDRCNPHEPVTHAPAEPGLNAMPTTIPAQATVPGLHAGPEVSRLLEFRNIRVVYDNAIEAI